MTTTKVENITLIILCYHFYDGANFNILNTGYLMQHYPNKEYAQALSFSSSKELKKRHRNCLPLLELNSGDSNICSWFYDNYTVSCLTLYMVTVKMVDIM